MHQALDELREVITVLRDDDDFDGKHPLPGLADLDGLIAETRDAGTAVDVTRRVTQPEDLPGGLGRTAYRVVQEGLTNARKHAPGRPVRVLLAGKPGGRLVVELANPVWPGRPGHQRERDRPDRADRAGAAGWRGDRPHDQRGRRVRAARLAALARGDSGASRAGGTSGAGMTDAP